MATLVLDPPERRELAPARATGHSYQNTFLKIELDAVVAPNQIRVTLKSSPDYSLTLSGENKNFFASRDLIDSFFRGISGELNATDSLAEQLDIIRSNAITHLGKGNPQNAYVKIENYWGSSVSLDNLELDVPAKVPELGYLSKESILTQTGINKIFSKMEGECGVLFLDFNAMGIADKSGLTNEINKFLKIFPDKVKEVLKDFNPTIARIGGDEYAIFFEKCAGIEGKLAELIKITNDLKSEFFPASDPRMEKATTSAAIRSALRAIFKEFKEDIVYCDKTLDGFFRFLNDKYKTRANFDQSKYPYLNHNYVHKAGLCALRTAISKSKVFFDPNFVMSFTSAAVDIPKDRTPQNISRALGQAAKQAQNNKLNSTITATINRFDEKIELRESDQIQIDLAEQSYLEKSALESVRKTLSVSSLGNYILSALLRIQHYRDTTLGRDENDAQPLNVIRKEKADTLRAQDVISPHSTRYYIEIPGFGSHNSAVGYSRGDQIALLIANALQTAVPEGRLVIRDGGGAFILETKDELSDTRWKQIRTVIDKTYAKIFDRIHDQNELGDINFEIEKARKLYESGKTPDTKTVYQYFDLVCAYKLEDSPTKNEDVKSWVDRVVKEVNATENLLAVQRFNSPSFLQSN